MKFTPCYTNRWIKDLKKYASLRKHILTKIDKILENPYKQAREILKGVSKSRKLDLTGLRSAEVLGKYRIIYILCEECVKKSLRNKRIFYCENCQEDKNRIVFLCFGSHDEAYLMR